MVQKNSYLISECRDGSADFNVSFFGRGCLFDCTFCTVKAVRPSGVLIYEDIERGLAAIRHHASDLPDRSDFWLYNIGQHEDFGRHTNYRRWEHIFKFFKEHGKIKAQFSTRSYAKDLLDYDAGRRIRVGVPMVPTDLIRTFEPGTSPLHVRIRFANKLYQAGYDVFLDFSPIIIYHNWFRDYNTMLKIIDLNIDNDLKGKIDGTARFLMMNKNRHIQNTMLNKKGRSSLWNSQQQSTTRYSFLNNVHKTYSHTLFTKLSQRFMKEINECIPWCDVKILK